MLHWLLRPLRTRHSNVSGDTSGQWAAMHRTPREGQDIVQGLVLPIVPHCPAPLSDIVQTLSRTVRYCPELCGIVVLAGGRSRTGDSAARAAVPRRPCPSTRSSRGHRSCAACVARDSGGIFACLHCAPGCPAPVPLWTANYGPRRIWLVAGVARPLRGVVYRVVTVQGV